jgi:NAD(P)H-dependent flavin oxidoreductase YrpB (nitropropane dioxygenase family)
MKTKATELVGIDLPIFAFSHCRDVVAAVTNAGGCGVLGAVAHSPEQLDIDLKWIEDEVKGKPYGVDLLVPQKFVGADEGGLDRDALRALLPPEHQAFLDDILARYDVPPAPDDVSLGGSIGGMRVDPKSMAPLLDVLFAHQPKLVASALGPPPPHFLELAHSAGVPVAALAGSVVHAERHAAAGADLIVAQGTEAGGHTGMIATMVLVPEVVDAVAPVPVLAAGGVANGRQIAAALALGADGVWTGSLWVACAESEFLPEQIGRVLRAGSHDTVETRSWSGKPTRFLRDPWNSAWEEPGAPEPLPTPLQRILVGRSHHKMLNARMGEMLAVPIGQVVGQITSVRKVQDIIYDLVTEYADAMERLQSLSPPER